MSNLTVPQNQINSDSSGDEITTNYEGYSSNPMQSLQDPLQYQTQIPPQPIYPDPQNPYFQPQPQPPVLTPQHPPIYPNNQPPNYPNSEPQTTFSQPPPSQNEIITNDIEQPMTTCGTVMQIIFIIYLFGYSIYDIIFLVNTFGGINIAFVDDCLLMLLGIIIIIYAVRAKQPNTVFLCIYGFLTWIIGFPFKVIGLTRNDHGIQGVGAILLVIRFFFVGIIFIYTCPKKIMDKLPSRRRGKHSIKHTYKTKK